MRKKIVYILLALVMCFSFSAMAACADSGKNEEEGGTTPPSVTDPTTPPEEEIVYEGDMLYNGFENMDDLYSVNQLYDWSYTPLGKLHIVGADDFVPVVEDPEAESAAAAVKTMIDALPAAETVTEFSAETKDAVAKARAAYGGLSDTAKLLVSNIDKLKALEASDALAGYYTLADFGGGFVSDITGAASWAAYSGTLADPTQGTIMFDVSGLNASIAGAFYISLFFDGSKDPGQSADGINIQMNTDNTRLVFANSGNATIMFEEGKTIANDKTYTFTVGYEVAADFASVKISVRIEDEDGTVIADGSAEVSSFDSTSFGGQAVDSWLNGSGASGHHGFFVGTGNSEGVNIASLWTGVSTGDYDEPISPDDPSLAPQEGEGAMRVYYEQGSFTQILARFDNSALSGLPVEKLGGFSVQIFNYSSSPKQVTLSLMSEQNVVVEVDGGTFTLAPYTWTKCKVTLDPIIIQYLADSLIGLNIRFANTTDSVYYVDDLRVQFDQQYTDEILEAMEAVQELTDAIAELDGTQITAESRETLESLYGDYMALPQAYRFTVENIEILNDAIAQYFTLIAGTPEEGQTILYFDQILGLTQVAEFTGGTASYTTETAAPGASGALQLDFNGAVNGWLDVNVTPTAYGNAYDEIRIWVKNDSDNKRAFSVDWNVPDAVYDENGEPYEITSNILPANSGWLQLVYRRTFTVGQLNICSVDENNQGISTIDTLYVGKVEIISNAPNVRAMIEALPAYSDDYSAEDKEAVAAARAAYDALNVATAASVTNIDKLVGIEAEIWREGFAALPDTPDGITEYNEEYREAIVALRTSYNALDPAVRALVSEDEELLVQFEEKIASSFAVENVTALLTGLTQPETAFSYTVADITAIRAARDAYDALTAEQQDTIEDALVSKLEACEADIANYYTLSDMTPNTNGLYAGDDAHDLSLGGAVKDWDYRVGNLASGRSMSGTVVFTATGFDTENPGAFYISLFHDGSSDAGQSQDGIVFQMDQDRLTAVNSGDVGYMFEQGMHLSATETYTFYVGYSVADDYSSVTINIRIVASNGSVLAAFEHKTETLTPKSEALGGSQSIEAWLSTHANAANHQTLYLNGGNSTGVTVSSAW